METKLVSFSVPFSQRNITCVRYIYIYIYRERERERERERDSLIYDSFFCPKTIG